MTAGVRRNRLLMLTEIFLTSQSAGGDSCRDSTPDVAAAGFRQSCYAILRGGALTPTRQTWENRRRKRVLPAREANQGVVAQNQVSSNSNQSASRESTTDEQATGILLCDFGVGPGRNEPRRRPAKRCRQGELRAALRIVGAHGVSSVAGGPSRADRLASRLVSGGE
jgi:hypothetical protein